jgi:hypothetical protein
VAKYLLSKWTNKVAERGVLTCFSTIDVRLNNTLGINKIFIEVQEDDSKMALRLEKAWA